jgi:hypothetical protein
MKTVVNIPDRVHRRLKSRAALEACSVSDLILRGVETALATKTNRKGKTRISLPLIKSSRPGHLRLGNKEINEVILR